jgi:hypothetical protein
MMKKLLGIAVMSLCTLAVAAPSQAQHSRGGGTVVRGTATVRSGAAVVAPRVVSPGFRPYYYPRYSFGIYAGYPYYSPYYYPYGYYGAYYGYPYSYPYPYGYGAYSAPYENGYNVAAGPVPAGPGRGGYGSVQIKDAPKDAQVFADGYYAGIVNDFDGAFQHLDLEAGPHHIEIREQGQPPVSVDVNVRPGETVTYHAR